ncbi:MAG: RNA methyltransferase [Rhodospirillaceae bacterium]|nr:RNA methyltransferase [Rhodospirillaceae bacterium]
MLITSLGNATVKLLASLRQEKYRHEHGLFLTEGARTAEDALAAGAAPRIVAAIDGKVSEPLRESCLKAGGMVIAVTPEVMAKITQRENPQAVAAAFPTSRASFDKIAPSTGDVFVALDRVRDPGNLGTIIRTAHAVGACGVLLVGPSCDPYATESVRATTGSIFHVPIYEGSEADFLALLKRWPGSVVGAAASGSSHYRKTTYTKPVLAVMGTEQSGLSPAITKACNTIVHIPMHGTAESLNVSVATGVLLYGIRDGLAG